MMMTSPKPVFATRVWAPLQSQRERCGATLHAFIPPIRARDPRLDTETTWRRGSEESGENKRTRGGTKVSQSCIRSLWSVRVIPAVIHSAKLTRSARILRTNYFPNYYSMHTWINQKRETCLHLFFECRLSKFAELAVRFASFLQSSASRFHWLLQHSAALLVALPHRVINFWVFTNGKKVVSIFICQFQ